MDNLLWNAAMEFIESITNNGAMGTLIRIPKEALCRWLCDQCETHYEKGYQAGHTAASLAAISELANSEPDKLDPT